MTDYVVDTDIVSYGFRQDTRFAFYRPLLIGNRAFVSFMTIAELDYWGASRNWGQRRKQQLESYVRRHFVMYAATRQLCSIWSDVTLEAKNKGRIIRCADAWIAATAIRLGAPLMTNNVKDFEFLDGLQIVAPQNP
jgi:predicted nucleic acid-binding protein